MQSGSGNTHAWICATLCAFDVSLLSVCCHLLSVGILVAYQVGTAHHLVGAKMGCGCFRSVSLLDGLFLIPSTMLSTSRTPPFCFLRSVCTMGTMVAWICGVLGIFSTNLFVRPEKSRFSSDCLYLWTFCVNLQTNAFLFQHYFVTLGEIANIL